MSDAQHTQPSPERQAAIGLLNREAVRLDARARYARERANADYEANTLRTAAAILERNE